MKLYWKVSPPKTGHFMSFQFRSWPTAHFDKDERLIAVQLYCTDEYVPALVKEGKHAPIRIRIADYSKPGGSFDWKLLTRVAMTLEEAKELAEQFWRTEANKCRLPKELRK